MSFWQPLQSSIPRQLSSTNALTGRSEAYFRASSPAMSTLRALSLPSRVPTLVEILAETTSEGKSDDTLCMDSRTESPPPPFFNKVTSTLAFLPASSVNLREAVLIGCRGALYVSNVSSPSFNVDPSTNLNTRPSCN